MQCHTAFRSKGNQHCIALLQPVENEPQRCNALMRQSSSVFTKTLFSASPRERTHAGPAEKSSM